MTSQKQDGGYTNSDKTQLVKLWHNSNCDKAQWLKLWEKKKLKKLK